MPTNSKKPRNSTRSIYRRVQELCNMPRRTAAMAVRGTIRAIHDCLLEGEPAQLHQLGKFHFKIRKGRHVPERRYQKHGKLVVIPAGFQPDTIFLKWMTAQDFKRKLKKVPVEKVR